MNSANSKPYLNICQDSMLGGYLLTKEKIKIPKEIFFDAVCKYDLSYILEKLDYIHNILSKQDGKTWIAGQDDYLPEYLTGHNLISMLVPNTFEYKKDDIVFHKGIMVSGILTSKACASEHGSIPHYLYLNYGDRIATDFISHFSFICDFYIMHRGFSVGINDCISNVGFSGLKSDGVCIINSKEERIYHKTVKEIILSPEEETSKIEMNKCFVKALEIRDSKVDEDDTVANAKIMMALGDAVSIGKVLAKNNLKKDNSFVQMVFSGSKGNYTNITQITGLVGLQVVEGAMIPMNFTYGKCLPHFQDYTNVKSSDLLHLDDAKQIFLSQGFVENNFMRGLIPSEFWFASCSSRTGLCDTAVKTATTGYLERKMVKMMEDLKIQYDGTVINSEGNCVQFVYGDDDLDASEVIKTKNDKYTFIDIDNIVDILNTEEELNL